MSRSTRFSRWGISAAGVVAMLCGVLVNVAAPAQAAIPTKTSPGVVKFRDADIKAAKDYWTQARMDAAAAGTPMTKSSAPAKAEPKSLVANTSVPQTAASVDSSNLPRIGKFFYHVPVVGDIACTGSVLNTQTRNIVVTAGHCVWNHYCWGSVCTPQIPNVIIPVFVPGYAAGQSPYGTWTPKEAHVATQWTTSGFPNFNIDFDFGAYLMQPNSAGQQIGDVVGGMPWTINAPDDLLTIVVGYPNAATDPIGCDNIAYPFRNYQWQLQIYCPASSGGGTVLTEGASGGPFVATGGIAYASTGGHDEGGKDSDPTSYGVKWNNYFADLIKQVVEEQGVTFDPNTITPVIECPGDPACPPTVSDARQRIVNEAETQVGTSPETNGDNCEPYYTNFASPWHCGEPWCAYFASWVWRQAGVWHTNFGGANQFYYWGQPQGLTRDFSHIKPGDVVLYGTSAVNSVHIGVVETVWPDGDITTIEGNWSNSVVRKDHFNPANTGWEPIYAVVSPFADGPAGSPPAVASNVFPVTATLDGRTAMDLNNHAYPNKYPSGSVVTVVCQDSGPAAYGSTIWDFTSDGLWVTDAYVKTGYSSYDPNLPRCGTGAAPAPGGGNQFPATTTLDGRTAKDLNNHAYPNKYPSGSLVSLACQDTGPAAYSSTIWDLTWDDLWVPDAYIKTGYSSFDPYLPRCGDGLNPQPGAGNQFPVTATLDGRTAKDIDNHAYPSKYPSGTTITVSCQDSGPVAYGSSIWDYTSDGLWVTDVYVKTGYSGFDPALPRCGAGGSNPPTVTGNQFVTTATLDGRTAEDLNNHAYPNKYPSGTTITVACQDTGPLAYGSTVWDYTSDNLWVTDAYVKTGYAGFDPNLPACSGAGGQSPPPVGNQFPVTSTLDGRTAKDLNNHAYPNRYGSGTTITVTCQDTGPAAYGSTVWDYTSDNLWVTDAYVRTGYTGFDPNLPRC